VRRGVLLGTIIIALISSGLRFAGAYPRPGEIERVSVSTSGERGGGQFEPNWQTDVSPEGRYVVFDGWSPKLAPEHDDGGVAKSQVYIRDREASTTELASVNAHGVKADSHSSSGVISPDARYIAFSSLGRNLAPGSSMGAHQIYLRDRETGTIERVSVNAAGEAGAAPGAFTRADSEAPSMTPDARYVAFQSRATNLVATPDVNGSALDVYVRDRVTQTTERVSVDGAGVQLDGESLIPHISDDGRYIAFENFSLEVGDALRFPPREDNVWKSRVYIHDRDTGETVLVSIASDGAPANGDAMFNGMTPDGRFVVFSSDATNLVPHSVDPEVLPDCNFSSEEGGLVCRDRGPWNVYVHDRASGVTERASVTDAGEQGNGPSSGGFISDDGRSVVFLSGATNLVAGDTNGGADIFVHDRVMGTVERVSVSNSGGQLSGQCGEPTRISADGRFPVFTCFGGGLMPDAPSDGIDVFVRDRGPVLGIGHLTAIPDDMSLLVSGWATFSGEVLAEAADPGNDGQSTGDPPGGELTKAELVYRAERESLLARWHVDDLPGGGAPGVMYGLGFEAGGASYEIRGAATTSDAPDFALYQCDPACIEMTPVEASYGDVGSQVWAVIPLDAFPAGPGDELASISAYTATGTPSSGPLLQLDDVALAGAAIPEMLVEVAVAPIGTAPAAVAFETAALSEGAFSAQLDMGDPSFASELWARACLGDICETASEPLGEGPEPSPSGSTSSTPDPTVSPTSEPTADPVPEGTNLMFTERSATGGQYSDEVLFEAELTDSSGDPLAGREFVFELAGAESSRTFTATTDDDGVASVGPTLTETPGPHQLTVRFAGDDDHAPSADGTAFVVDKEDSTLELTVEGKGSNRTVTARLTDEDTSSAGIAGRTIDFYGDDEPLGSATTDEDGVATLQAPPRYRGGKHDFEARFEGDDYYDGSSDGEAT